MLAFVLAFAQAAVAAHACPIADAPATPVTANVAPMTDCGGMPAPADPAANLCETHCLVGQQAPSDNGSFPPIAVVPPLALPMLPASLDGLAASVDAGTPLPTPPPLLRFTRLLI